MFKKIYDFLILHAFNVRIALLSIIVISALVYLGKVSAGYSYWIFPGQTVSFVTGDSSFTITNATRKILLLDDRALADTVTVNGNGSCYSVIVDPGTEYAGRVIDGKIHIDGSDATLLNAGFFGACYISRFSPPFGHQWESQLYDANTLGLAQASVLSGKTYKEFVAYMGGSTYLPEASFRGIFHPYKLPLNIWP